MTSQELIHFSQSTVSALKTATIDKFAAVATAAREAIDHDRKVTVRCFADSLRAVTVGLGMAQVVLAAAIKAAKDGANVEEAMTAATLTAASKAREARARASKKAEKQAEVDALANVEDTIAGLTGGAKSSLLVRIEEQRTKVAQLVADLKTAREQLANLEADYLVRQKTALKQAVAAKQAEQAAKKAALKSA